MATPENSGADRSARLNMRISPDALATLKSAASAQQQDLTSFVLGAALQRARDVLMEERVLRISPAAMDQIEAALAEDAQPVPELVALVHEMRARRINGSDRFQLASS